MLLDCELFLGIEMFGGSVYKHFVQWRVFTLCNALGSLIISKPTFGIARLPNHTEKGFSSVDQQLSILSGCKLQFH